MPHFVLAACHLTLLGAAAGLCLAAGAPTGTGPHAVILITVDGARADLLDQPDRIPFTSQLAREGRSLAFATTPTSVTFPAAVSIMTGLYPDRSGVRDDYASPLGRARATIAETFQKAGWKTAAFPADYLCHARSGIDRGYEEFLVVSPSIDENARADSAVAFLDRNRGVHSLVWVGFSLLAPQQPWERFRGSAATDTAAYLDRAAATDQAIGRLLTGIGGVSRIQESLVILVGTHGESIPGWKPAGAPAEEDPPPGNGLDLSETVLRVPLVFSWEGIHGSGASAERTRPDWVSTIDVFPTIASFAGVPVPDSLDGVSLRPMLEGSAAPIRPIFHELQLGRTLGWGARIGVREGSFKLLSYGGSTALLCIDRQSAGSLGEEEIGREKTSLREALQQRFKIEVELPQGGKRDPAFGQEDEQMRLLAQARERSSARNSAEILHRLVIQFPDNGPVRIERAMLDVYGRRERFAAAALDSLRKARPDYVEVEAAYSELLIRFDRTGVAVPRLSSLAGWPMFEVDRLWRLGASQVLAKQFDDAARTYRLAETIGYPSDQRLVRFRDQRLQMRRLETEIASYPDRTVSMIEMARIFGDLELYDDCYAWLHRARGTASLDAEPEYWLGHYLLEEGRAKHASVAFKRALEKDSTRVDARVELAYAEIAQDESAEALANLRKAAASGETDAVADYNLACLLARKGEVDESLRFLSDAVRKGYSNRKLLETDPDLDPLRKDPRFSRIIADLH